jgi:AAA ATPase domain
MADLTRFRGKVREYRLLVGRNQADLAHYLDLDYTELSNRLNATKKARLSHENVRMIIRALVDWGAIATRAQATELLGLMDSPDFDLVDWQAPPLTKLKPAPVAHILPPSQTDQQARLKAISTSPAKFMLERLSNFVGRAEELKATHKIIDELLPTGGYLTITGPAGQGKSSLIARLVADYSQELGGYNQVIHHFIPFSPGQDHQTSLLRDIMAQLILKHGLADFYLSGESRSVLRDYFKKLLEEIAAKGKAEIIFIDGLDQLENELNGSRDLSFLPPNVPNKIVFVLGTRPNDTLKPLELLKPLREYRLPDLTLPDFGLLLKRFGVKTDPTTVSQLYELMQHNALYLTLASQELSKGENANPTEIIQVISDNPDYLFSIAIERLKQPREIWREVIKPLLGVLLVLQEPLGLRELRQIIGIEDDLLREGLRRLGGLLAYNEDGRPYLYHLKLQDYLRQDPNHPNKNYLFAFDEEEAYHANLAGWCEENLKPAQMDLAGDYARQYYVRHLYRAKQWAKLYEVLDKGEYGQIKLASAVTMGSYAGDLELGKLATVRPDLPYSTALELLPKLWYYSLLRCRLAERASRYSDEAISSSFVPQKLQAMLAWTELLTLPEEKIYWLGRLAVRLDREEADIGLLRKVLLKAYEALEVVNRVEVKLVLLPKLFALTDLSDLRLVRRAETLARSLANFFDRAKMLTDLSRYLERAGQTREANRLNQAVQELQSGIEPATLKLLEQNHLEKVSGVKINTNWGKAAPLTINSETEKAEAQALSFLAIIIAQSGNIDLAHQICIIIANEQIKTDTLFEIARIASQSDEVRKMLAEAEEIINQLPYSAEKTELLQKLILKLSETGDLIKAIELARSITNPLERVIAFAKIAANTPTSSTAELLWTEAYQVARGSPVPNLRAVSLKELAVQLALAGQTERAITTVNEIELAYLRVAALSLVAIILIGQEQLECARALVNTAHDQAHQIQDTRPQMLALRELVQAYILLGESQTAEKLAGLIPHDNEQAKAFQFIALELAKQQNWVGVRRLTAKIKDPYLKALTLCRWADEYFNTGHPTEADQILTEVQIIERRLPLGDEKAQVQAALVNNLILQEEWDKALTVATASTTPKALNQAALTAVIAGLFKAAKKREALQILQNQWLKAATTGQLLALLPLCQPLLTSQPELFSAIYNSFEGVTNFLGKMSEPDLV